MKNIDRMKPRPAATLIPPSSTHKHDNQRPNCLSNHHNGVLNPLRAYCRIHQCGNTEQHSTRCGIPASIAQSNASGDGVLDNRHR